MKRFSFFFFLLLFLGCKNQKTERIPVKIDSKSYSLFGDNFDSKDALTTEELTQKLSSSIDTLTLTLQGTIKEVCSKKGCWMTLALDSDEDLMVRFKDYGFFMPLDASGEVIIHGKAYVSETSVADLRHYAQDAGATQLEIGAIISPKLTYNFEADGVLLAQ